MFGLERRVTDGITKFLWVVSLKEVPPKKLLDHVRASRAQAVCLRTSNHDLPATIALIRSEGIKVFGWRWPAVVRQQSSPPHYFALDEARYVSEALIPAGLDGYIVDPESDHAGDADDWNHEALAPLAQEFCAVIARGVAASGHTDFRFGITSGANFPTPQGKPHIPWPQFVEQSDAVYPQSYWRWRRPTDARTQDIHGGRPDVATSVGHAVWRTVCSGKPIIPIGGELDVITASEIATFGKEVLKLGNEVHFYADTNRVPPANYRAIARISLPAVVARGRPPAPAPPPAKPIPKPEKKEPKMLLQNSELQNGGPPPQAPPGSDWLYRVFTFVRRLWWIVVSLLSALVALQAFDPKSLLVLSALGPTAQRVVENLFDKPAALRQSDYLGQQGFPLGFLGYIYYVGLDCGGLKAGGGTIVTIPCLHQTPPASTDFAIGTILRINGDVEIRAQPWDQSPLVAAAQNGQCVIVIARAVRHDGANDDPTNPGRWLPIGRTPCPKR